jgi:hypothetical protein
MARDRLIAPRVRRLSWRPDTGAESKRAAFARPFMKTVRNENRAGKMATYSFPQA